MLSTRDAIAGRPFPLPATILRESIEPGDTLVCCRHCGGDDIRRCVFHPYAADVHSFSILAGQLLIEEQGDEDDCDGEPLDDPAGVWFCSTCNTQGNDEILVIVVDGVEVEPANPDAITPEEVLNLFGASGRYVVTEAPIYGMAVALAELGKRAATAAAKAHAPAKPDPFDGN